ncbi:hypothetical protein KC323_g214 [Hortaea werneckii]|nr:hypothetical protein KC323_g214 [Hortaea werneckii]
MQRHMLQSKALMFVVQFLLPATIRRILLPAHPLCCISIFLTGHDLDLGNTVAVPQDNTDLRRGDTLPGQLADLVDDLVGGGLQPRRRGARVWDGRVGDTLALAVQTTHFDVGVGPVDGGGLEGCGGRRRRRCWLTESSSQPSTLRENLAWVLAISGIQRNSSDASMSFRNLVSRLPHSIQGSSVPREDPLSYREVTCCQNLTRSHRLLLEVVPSL